MTYYYYVRNRDLELEYHKPNDHIDRWRARGYLDPSPRGGGQNRSHRLEEGDSDMLQGMDASLGKFLGEVLGLSFPAYGSNGEPKESRRKRHEMVESSSLRNLLPLDIAGSDKEGNKDAWTTGPALTKVG